MSEKKVSPLFRMVKGALRAVYPRIRSLGTENIPREPAVFVGNHTQLHGPIACELHFPVPRYTWCAGQMMNLKEVPGYAFADFWSQKPKRTHWYYRICSYLIAPLSVFIFNNANTIAVHRDARILTTFRETLAKLQEGFSVVIFPEHDQKHNHIVYDFQEGYIDVARLYHRKTGRELCFVPFYIAPSLRRMVFGKPVRFRSDAPIAEEKARINQYLMNEITQTAQRLPRHIVVPYRNIPKKDYPYNISGEVQTHEKTRG